MKAVSDKQRAKRLANGERFIGSSIAPKPVQPQPSSGYCPIRRKTKVKKAKPIPKRGPGKAKREARNAAYYKSAEWRAKRKAVFERDDYRCTEKQLMDRRDYDERVRHGLDTWPVFSRGEGYVWLHCPNRGEIVNGKQTGRGLVAEEKSYFHRDKPENIDRIVTRCKDCDRRLTPLERINHSHGFQNRRG